MTYTMPHAAGGTSCCGGLRQVTQFANTVNVTPVTGWISALPDPAQRRESLTEQQQPNLSGSKGMRTSRSSRAQSPATASDAVALETNGTAVDVRRSPTCCLHMA